MTSDSVATMDLSQVSGMILDDNGKLKPYVKQDGDEESAMDPTDMQDLYPIGLRFSVRAHSLPCVHPHARAHVTSVCLPSQWEAKKSVPLKGIDAEGCVITAYVLCTHPKFWDRVFQFKWYSIPLEIRKDWAKQFSAEELKRMGFPDPQLFVYGLAKDNLMLRLNKKILKITRRADRYDPCMSEFEANYRWWLFHPDFFSLVKVYRPNYEEEFDKRGINLADASVPVPMLLSTPERGASPGCDEISLGLSSRGHRHIGVTSA